MNHNKEFLKLQEQYIIKKDKRTLGLMLIIIGEIATNFTNKYVKEKHLSKNEYDVEDITSKVILRVLERYNRNPEWKVEANVSGSIYFDWFKVISHKQNNQDKQQGWEDNNISYEELVGL